MGKGTYYVLDYSSGRIIPDLTLEAVLVTARVLMCLPNPSFDILENIIKKIVTADFVAHTDKTWHYEPQKVVMFSSDKGV